VGVSYCCLVFPDVVAITEVPELLFSELCAIISDDIVGDPKAEDNVLDKAYRFL
jgi:hypothetical protein